MCSENFPEIEYAERWSDKGDRKKVPVLKLVGDLERRLVSDFCRKVNRPNDFIFLLDMAEQRAIRHARLLSENVNIAARRIDDLKPLTDDMMGSWLRERDEPNLFQD
jgi:hypothetical protein